MEHSITLTNIGKSFTEENKRSLVVLEDINLKITKGEFFILLGPSGCGKSTLLRIMSGLEKNHRGTVTLAADITRHDISFIFQQFALLPWLTIYENVEVGLLALEPNKETRKKRIMEELKKLGLESFALHYPRELSGGMKQRVGIARALVRNPKIIFMDEPFSALDSFTAKILRDEMLRLWEKEKRTIVMVTHNTEEALELGDRIAVMTARPGKIESIISNTLSRPRNPRSAEFFKLEDELYGLVKI